MVGEMNYIAFAELNEQPQKYSRSIRLFSSLGLTLGSAPFACVGRDTFG